MEKLYIFFIIYFTLVTEKFYGMIIFIETFSLIKQKVPQRPQYHKFLVCVKERVIFPFCCRVPFIQVNFD